MSQSPTSERRLALRVMTMPRDTNQYGTIFGGVILSYVDQAGFVEARRHGTHRWVTVSIDRVDFNAPVLIGDVVSFLTDTIASGTSSVQLRVCVESERFTTSDVVPVTEATLTMVAVNAAGHAHPVVTAAVHAQVGVVTPQSSPTWNRFAWPNHPNATSKPASSSSET